MKAAKISEGLTIRFREQLCAELLDMIMTEVNLNFAQLEKRSREPMAVNAEIPYEMSAFHPAHPHDIDESVEQIYALWTLDEGVLLPSACAINAAAAAKRRVRPLIAIWAHSHHYTSDLQAWYNVLSRFPHFTTRISSLELRLLHGGNNGPVLPQYFLSFLFRAPVHLAEVFLVDCSLDETLLSWLPPTLKTISIVSSVGRLEGQHLIDLLVRLPQIQTLGIGFKLTQKNMTIPTGQRHLSKLRVYDSSRIFRTFRLVTTVFNRIDWVQMVPGTDHTHLCLRRIANFVCVGMLEIEHLNIAHLDEVLRSPTTELQTLRLRSSGTDGPELYQVVQHLSRLMGSAVTCRSLQIVSMDPHELPASEGDVLTLLPWSVLTGGSSDSEEDEIIWRRDGAPLAKAIAAVPFTAPFKTIWLPHKVDLVEDQCVEDAIIKRGFQLRRCPDVGDRLESLSEYILDHFFFDSSSVN